MFMRGGLRQRFYKGLVVGNGRESIDRQDCRA